MTGAGELNQRIRLERPIKVENSRGELVKVNWELVITVWAKAMPLRGREFFAASAEQAEITTKFRIRYRTGIQPTWRVVWKGEPYDIASPPIEVGGGREWIELMCTNGVKDGRN